MAQLLKYPRRNRFDRHPYSVEWNWVWNRNAGWKFVVPTIPYVASLTTVVVSETPVSIPLVLSVPITTVSVTTSVV
jgi:hypothetical protein